MESNTSDTSNNKDAKAAAENLAKHAGASARNVGEAARGMADDARQQFDEGVEGSRHYVQEHPLQSVGYGAAIGVLVGLLITRR